MTVGGNMTLPEPYEGVPSHVAIIMDGNGRWAAARGLPRLEGHRRGVEAVRRAIKSAADLGIKYLTIYSFSSENWRRPAQEINDLFGLLKLFIKRDLAELHKNNVRIRIIGSREGLPVDILTLLDDAQTRTANNTALTLVVAFNYGARLELVDAVKAIAHKVQSGEIIAEHISDDTVSSHLYTHDIPDPDILIRTSGEERLSNFLLWQLAYTELVFTPVLWPDFEKSHLEEAIKAFSQRDRRFGGLTQQAQG
jgi:undecaprenyl diphosphate synthase